MKKSFITNIALQLTGIFLVALIAFSLFGPYLSFRYQQIQVRKEIKKQIKQGVPESELQKFNLTDLSGKIKWTDGKREFSLNGNLYDVVKKEYTKDGVVFYCIDDKQESALFKDLGSLTEKEMEKKNTSLKYKLIIQFYYDHLSDINFTSDTDDQLTIYLQRTFSFSHSVLSPPPEV